MVPHTFAPIAPETDDEGGAGPEVWRWCIRCGVLALGSQVFAPGSHQHETIEADADPGCRETTPHFRVELLTLGNLPPPQRGAEVARYADKARLEGWQLLGVSHGESHGTFTLTFERMEDGVASTRLQIFELREAWARATNVGHMPQKVRDVFTRILGPAATAKDAL